MSIEIITGIPGAGKTLFTLDKVCKEYPERTIYYHNIADLKLDWIEMDDPKKWYELPHGAVIVIDEAHEVFRKFDARQSPPDFIEKFAYLRHQGHDVLLITQHAIDLPTFIRNRCKFHYILETPMTSTSKATVLKFKGFQSHPNIPDVRMTADEYHWSFPKELYDKYKSAEVHTKKITVPKTFYRYGAMGLIAVCALFFSVRSILQSFGMGEEEQPQQQQSFNLASIDTQVKNSIDNYFAQNTPRVSYLPHTAPKYDELNEPKSVPKPQCLSTKNRCQCYTEQITKLNIPESQCRDIVENGYYDDSIGG